MASYIFRRLIQSIPILIGIAVISFLIVHIAPGSPIDRFRSGRVSPETIQNLIRLYGLDQPLPQVREIFERIAQGDGADGDGIVRQ